MSLTTYRSDWYRRCALIAAYTMSDIFLGATTLEDQTVTNIVLAFTGLEAATFAVIYSLYGTPFRDRASRSVLWVISAYSVAAFAELVSTMTRNTPNIELIGNAATASFLVAGTNLVWVLLLSLRSP